MINFCRNVVVKCAINFCAVFLVATTALAIPSTDATIAFNSEQSKTAIDIISKLGNRHYSSQSFDDQLSSSFFDNYLKRLDGNKSFFMQADIEAFEPYRYRLDNTLLKGDLVPGYIIFNRYQQRLIERLSGIVENLPEMVASMDFTLDEELELERKDDPWPLNTEQADNLWRKIIKSRVVSLRIAEKPEEEIVPLLQKRYQNQLNRVMQSNSEDAFQVYINSMTALYDPHTNYLSNNIRKF